MHKSVTALKEVLSPVRDRLIHHPVYQDVQSSAALRIFMQHHVYAVWDFMSLLKALQRSLTVVSIPWVPRGNANTRYLINEIVVGEESDVDEEGRRTSHFELYLRAMQQAGADILPVSRLLQAVEEGVPVEKAIRLHVPEPAVRDFMEFTFSTIASGKIHAIAAVFTFGREDLIPDMFLQIVQDLCQEAPGQLTIFSYYLERHIEVDGGHHSHLAISMLEELCGDDAQKWEEATAYARAALESRIRLWDGVLASIGKTVVMQG
jgi:hypothetical protein